MSEPLTLDHRELDILAIAREYVGMDGAEIGATPGVRVWRSGDAGAVRRHFLEAVGRGDTPDRRPARAPVQIEWTFGSGRMHVSGEVRSRQELRTALRAFGMDPASFALGVNVPLKVTLNGQSVSDFTELMPERPPTRRRERDSLTVARTLTLHYLSRKGGGARSRVGATFLWEAQGQEWRLPASWRSQHSRTLRWIREILGEV